MEHLKIKMIRYSLCENSLAYLILFVPTLIRSKARSFLQQ